MNWVDAVIVLVFLIYLLEGLKRGFVEQILELIGFFLTIFLAVWTYQPIGSWLISHAGVAEQAADPLAFLIDWTVLQALYSLGLRYAYPLLPALVRRSKSNHVGGIIPALLKGFIIVSVILTITVILPVPAKLKSEINNSFLGSKFVAQSATVEADLNKIFGRDVKQTLTFLTVPAQTEQIVEPNQTVDLKFTTTDVTVDTASEQKMFNLLNQERIKVGLQPLAWDEKLAVVARAHSKDMFARGYFAHQNPDGQSPFDRMQANGISFQAAGENLAYAASVELAHDGLMRSPGHRANILEKDFHKVGIGVIDGGIYGKMFTQDFTD